MSKSMEELVRDWTATEREVTLLQGELIEAMERRDGAATKLGELLAPSDMQLGETISVWVRVGHKQERLLTVRCEDKLPRASVDPVRVYTVNFRGRPRKEK